MTTHKLIDLLHEQAKELARKQHAECANTMTLAAEALQKYVSGIDAIYNHNAAARDAAVQHFGLWHLVDDSANAESEVQP